MHGVEVGQFAIPFTDTLETMPGLDRRGARSPDVGAAGPSLIVVIERHHLTAGGRRVPLDDLDELVVGRGSAGSIERAGRAATLYVTDARTSRRHLVIRRGAAGWQVEDLGSRNGTVHNGERVDRAALWNGDLVEAGGAILRFQSDSAPCTAYETGDHGPVGFPRTLNVALEHRLQQARKIAPSNVPVLVRGETGTGKELLARAVHDASGRQGAFVAVNCGALPRELIESELFGHRKGAFSGATDDHAGLVRRAHRGTLFLDEIAELPAESQVALLRVLQEGEVRPVGASEDVKIDVRVIAATHQDLAGRIADGRFRQDLYGRIAGFEITMPALRDRGEDIGTLIAEILPRVCTRPESLVLDRGAARALLGYPWPQNIRELEQALRAAVALGDGGEIRVEHLPEAVAAWQPSSTPALDAHDQALRERLIELLRRTGGNIAAVARELDRAPLQIRRWCRRLQVDVSQFR